jgi:hypothetical protein
MVRRYGLPFWWIIAHIDGADVLYPGGETENEARNKASWTLKGEPYDIEMFTTRDLGEATRRWKYRKLMNTGNIRGAIEPVKHTIPQSKRQPQNIPMVDITQL